MGGGSSFINYQNDEFIEQYSFLPDELIAVLLTSNLILSLVQTIETISRWILVFLSRASSAHSLFKSFCYKGKQGWNGGLSKLIFPSCVLRVTKKVIKNSLSPWLEFQTGLGKIYRFKSAQFMESTVLCQVNLCATSTHELTITRASSAQTSFKSFHYNWNRCWKHVKTSQIT